MKCINCNSVISKLPSHPYHYIESGLDNVYLYGVDEFECPQCKSKIVEIPRMAELHIVLSIAISNKPASLVGEEIRFMRKEVGMTQKSFADSLGVDPVSISRWENNKEGHTEPHDKLIRYVFRAMLQKRLETLIDYIEQCLSQSEAVCFHEQRVDVNAEQLKYFTIRSREICESEHI